MSDMWPLCVDLDGTLVETDTLHEMLLALVRVHPIRALIALVSIPRVKAHFKQMVARYSPFDPAALPYRQDLLEWLRSERVAGRKLILAAGADSKVALAVSSHLAIFDAVIASDGRMNLTGENKARAIRAYLGSGPFLYAGDSRADVKTWSASAGAIVVNPTRSRLQALARAAVPVVRTFSDGPGGRRQSARRRSYCAPPASGS